MQDILQRTHAQGQKFLMKLDICESKNSGDRKSTPSKGGFSIDCILGKERHFSTSTPIKHEATSVGSNELDANRATGDTGTSLVFSTKIRATSTLHVTHLHDSLSANNMPQCSRNHPRPGCSPTSNVTVTSDSKHDDLTARSVGGKVNINKPSFSDGSDKVCFRDQHKLPSVTSDGKLPNITRFFEPVERLMPFAESALNVAFPTNKNDQLENCVNYVNVPFLKDMPVLRNFGRIEMNNRPLPSVDPPDITPVPRSSPPVPVTIRQKALRPPLIPTDVPPIVTSKSPEQRTRPDLHDRQVLPADVKTELHSAENTNFEADTVEYKETKPFEALNFSGNKDAPSLDVTEPYGKEEDDRLAAIHRTLCSLNSRTKIERKPTITKIEDCPSPKLEPKVEEESTVCSAENRPGSPIVNPYTDSKLSLTSAKYPDSHDVGLDRPAVLAVHPLMPVTVKRARKQTKQAKVEDCHDDMQWTQIHQQHVLQQHQFFLAQHQHLLQQQQHLLQQQQNFHRFAQELQSRATQVVPPAFPHEPISKMRKRDSASKTDDSAAPTKRSKPGYLCDKCGKMYCRKYVLKIHQRVHSGEKPLVCQICGKCFSDPSNMKKHVKLHETDHVTYPCKFCGRNFVRRRGLLNHLHSMHSRVPAPQENESKGAVIPAT